jgi:hypothetical protein
MRSALNTPQPVVIFFQKGAQATKEEQYEIEDLGFAVRCRNASLITEKNALDSFEPCDGVLGAIPPVFEKYPVGHPRAGQDIPDGRDVVEDWRDARRREIDGLGEEVEAEKLAAVDTKAPEGEKLGPDGKPVWTGTGGGK